MRTTLVIDDDLYRRVKAKAALEGRTVTELVEAGLHAALNLAPATTASHEATRRVSLPLVPANPSAPRLFDGMTVTEIHERVARLQLEDDLAHAASSP